MNESTTLRYREAGFSPHVGENCQNHYKSIILNQKSKNVYQLEYYGQSYANKVLFENYKSEYDKNYHLLAFNGTENFGLSIIKVSVFPWSYYSCLEDTKLDSDSLIYEKVPLGCRPMKHSYKFALHKNNVIDFKWTADNKSIIRYVILNCVFYVIEWAS